jgi:DNA modification methylase
MVILDLLHGDCLQVMKDLSGGSIDCFICDLPFGCLSGRAIGKAEEKKCWSGAETGCAWDVKIDLKAFWEQVKRLCKNEHTPVLMFCTTKFGAELIASNPSWFRYDLVWDKGRGVSFLSANKMPMRSHEMIYVFSKNGAYYQRVDVKGEFKKWHATPGTIQSGYTLGGVKERSSEGGEGARCVLSVLRSPAATGAGRHPTEKPKQLYTWLIERYCPPGGTILDPTAGSFNSCFAAYDLNRSAIGIEKDPGFFEKACKRADNLDTN